MQITLIRHGKPIAATNPKLDAKGYIKWIRQYDKSTVCANSRPRFNTADFKDYYIVSSQLPRAIHSCQIAMARMPDRKLPVFREMAIPRYKLNLKLRAWTWVYLSRLLWFCGYKAGFESFSSAKQRAERAAEQLIELAQQQQNVVLFGHGVMNFYIRKALMRRGWQLLNKSSNYWGLTQLECK